jgi:membrane protease YdiL (CAAX protease family)
MKSPQQTPDPSAANPEAPPAQPTDLEFSQLGRLGLVSWLRHVAAILTIIFCWFGLGTAATAAVATLTGVYDPSAPRDGFSLSGYLLISVPVPFLLAGVAVAVRFIHKRPLRSLITPLARINLWRVLQGFGLFLALAAASSGGWALLGPDRYQLVFHPQQWLLALPLIVVVTTVQASTEELLMRGYLLQTLGLFTRRTWLLAGINGLLFAVPHLTNPEVGLGPVLMFALYFSFGAFVTLVTLRDNRLELALGMHAANNLFAALIVTHPNSTLPTEAIWQGGALNPTYNLITFLIGAAIFYRLLVRRPRATAATRQPTQTS